MIDADTASLDVEGIVSVVKFSDVFDRCCMRALCGDSG